MERLEDSGNYGDRHGGGEGEEEFERCVWRCRGKVCRRIKEIEGEFLMVKQIPREYCNVTVKIVFD